MKAKIEVRYNGLPCLVRHDDNEDPLTKKEAIRFIKSWQRNFPKDELQLLEIKTKATVFKPLNQPNERKG